jgi:hypothetical protein
MNYFRASYWHIMIASLALTLRLNASNAAFLHRAHHAIFQGEVTIFKANSVLSGSRRYQGTSTTEHKSSVGDDDLAAPTDQTEDVEVPVEVPLYLGQGLFAVEKPLDWTSSDVVSYIRGILERDARNRGAKVGSVRSRRKKSRIVRVGHGGTLDPLGKRVVAASGILSKRIF